jgi:hypothetical protein
MNPDDFPAPQEGCLPSSARGANFLTEPKDRGSEMRAYIRDPGGHLIEVGQSARLLR